MQIRRFLAPCVALLIATAPTVLAQRNNDNNNQQQAPARSAAEQQDIQTLVMAVEAVRGGQAAPADIPVTWQSNHFVKGQSGETYIPFTIRVDRTKLKTPNARMYIRAVDKNAPPPAPPAETQKPADGQKPAPPVPVNYAWDKIYMIQVPDNGELSRAIQLKPGSYDLFVAVKDVTPDAPQQGNQRNQRNQQQQQQPAAGAESTVSVGMLRRDLTVPDFTVAELKTSSVILATNVEPTQGQLSPADQEANPYVFGPMRIVNNPGAQYSKGGELHVIFWIYGAQAAPTGKPDVTIEYNFHQRLAEGEKYFNRTQPQELNAQSLPPEFSVAAGHQLPGSLVVPMSAFPAGDYRLEIKVTDKISSMSVTENVNFTVLPV